MRDFCIWLLGFRCIRLWVARRWIDLVWRSQSFGVVGLCDLFRRHSPLLIDLCGQPVFNRFLLDIVGFSHESARRLGHRPRRRLGRDSGGYWWPLRPEYKGTRGAYLLSLRSTLGSRVDRW